MIGLRECYIKAPVGGLMMKNKHEGGLYFDILNKYLSGIEYSPVE